MNSLLPLAKMPHDVQAIYDRLMKNLDELGVSTDPTVETIQQAVKRVMIAMAELRAWLESQSFESVNEEIVFFKYIKPRFYCQLLFHQQLHLLVSSAPAGDRKATRNYLKKKVEAIDHYFEENRELYGYFRRDHIYLDDVYFLRNVPQEQLPVEALRPGLDPLFSTPMDERVAEILKNELMLVHLSRQLDRLVADQTIATSSVPIVSKLKWTGPIKGAVQYIRSAVTSGSINNGKVTYAEVVPVFEMVLNINLKNFARATQEDRITKEPGAYMKFMYKSLLDDYNRMDEHPR